MQISRYFRTGISDEDCLLKRRNSVLFARQEKRGMPINAGNRHFLLRRCDEIDALDP
jgi:hypothetical protein